MNILVLDNYDSFTYNLVHILRELVSAGDRLEVHRNDKIALEQVEDFQKVLLSPGPGVPSEAGIMPELIKRYGAHKSILGVCLGHQAIAEAYDSSIYNMDTVLHGVQSTISLVDATEPLFVGLPKELNAARYHSWAVVSDRLSDQLRVTARSADGQIMGIRHQQHDVAGLQFHPESIITQHGKQMIDNWLRH